MSYKEERWMVSTKVDYDPGSLSLGRQEKMEKGKMF